MHLQQVYPFVAVTAILAAASVSCTNAQEPADYPPPPGHAGSPESYGAPPPPPGGEDPLAQLPPLDQLVAPVALYPDPVLSLLLPAATSPADIQSAANYLSSGGDPNDVDSEPWSDAVKGLAHYPGVVTWMAQNPEWTGQLGGAFADQPADVMNAVQDLRRRALAAGTLRSNAEIQVLEDAGIVRIVPAQANVIYVPQYEPDVVYFGGEPGPYFEWGSPYPAGIWLSFGFDWGGHRLWRGDWFDYERRHGGWRAPMRFGHGAVGGREWRGPSHVPQARGYRPADGHYARPQTMRGAPQRRSEPADRGGHRSRAAAGRDERANDDHQPSAPGYTPRDAGSPAFRSPYPQERTGRREMSGEMTREKPAHGGSERYAPHSPPVDRGGRSGTQTRKPKGKSARGHVERRRHPDDQKPQGQ
ncbi:MAG: DUF3300 domain-containing protein [Opitutaceae bacterium]